MCVVLSRSPSWFVWEEHSEASTGTEVTGPSARNSGGRLLQVHSRLIKTVAKFGVWLREYSGAYQIASLIEAGFSEQSIDSELQRLHDENPPEDKSDQM